MNNIIKDGYTSTANNSLPNCPVLHLIDCGPYGDDYFPISCLEVTNHGFLNQNGEMTITLEGNRTALRNLATRLASNHEGTAVILPTLRMLDIDRVIVNGPATIVFWNDGTKTVVKCGEDETWDDEKAIAMAVLKRLYGNKGAYFDLIRKGVEKLNEDLDVVRKGVERFGSNVNHLDLDATQLDLGSLTDVVNRLWDGLQ